MNRLMYYLQKFNKSYVTYVTFYLEYLILLWVCGIHNNKKDV